MPFEWSEGSEDNGDVTYEENPSFFACMYYFTAYLGLVFDHL